MKVKDALKITDSFTKTKKMPGLSYSLPAWECKTGAKLVKVPGSVCAGCYAMKGNYTRFPEIKKSQYKRLRGIDLEPQTDDSVEKEYTLTQGEADNWDDNSIGKSFNPSFDDEIN